MRFRSPKEDVLSTVFGLKLAVFVTFPVGLIVAVVRGDSPGWFYVVWVLGGVGLVLFTFVVLPNYQDWFAGKDLERGSDES